MRHITGLLALCALLSFAACADPDVPLEPLGEGLRRIDDRTVTGPRHLVRDLEPRGADGTVNVVVEIPSGTVAKWEVDKDDGSLRWEFEQGRPRVVDYLAYPGNYGMVPRTLLPEELGGDGDPLDVLILGQAVERSGLKSRGVATGLSGKLAAPGSGDPPAVRVGVPLSTGGRGRARAAGRPGPDANRT